MFKVELVKPFDDVPEEVLGLLCTRLEEIGKTLAALPPNSHLWPSLEASGMLLDVEGWRFQYAVDPKRRRLSVTGAAVRRK